MLLVEQACGGVFGRTNQKASHTRCIVAPPRWSQQPTHLAGDFVVPESRELFRMLVYAPVSRGDQLFL